MAFDGKALCCRVQLYLNQWQLLEIREAHQVGAFHFTQSQLWHFLTTLVMKAEAAGLPGPSCLLTPRRTLCPLRQLCPEGWALRAELTADHPTVWSFALNFFIVRDETFIFQTKPLYGEAQHSAWETLPLPATAKSTSMSGWGLSTKKPTFSSRRKP